MNENSKHPARRDIDISFVAILKVVGVILGLYIVYLIREVFALFFVSLVLSALINPLADWCAAKKVSRAVAVLATYIVLIGALAAIIVGIIPPISREFGQLMANSGDYMKAAFTQYGFLGSAIEQLGVADVLKTGFSSLQGSESGGGLFGTIQGVFAGIAAFTLVLALTFYMVVEDAALRRFFLSVTPHQYHEYFSVILPQVQKKLGAWLRGQLILASMVAIAVFIGLSLIGIKYALVLALLAGFAEFIPYVGPIVGAIPAVFLAFAQSPVIGFVVLVMYMVIQWTQNHIMVPKVMQKAIGINPIVSIMAFLVGAKVGGIVGVVLAIPISAAVLVFTQDFFAREEAKQNHPDVVI
ncbi:MAG: AI-2E family transporter [bacterium]